MPNESKKTTNDLNKTNEDDDYQYPLTEAEELFNAFTELYLAEVGNCNYQLSDVIRWAREREATGLSLLIPTGWVEKKKDKAEKLYS